MKYAQGNNLMKIHLLTGLCLLTSAGCLLIGYCLTEHWLILAFLPGVIIYWFIMRKKPGIWPVSIILVIYNVFAVAGLSIGLSPYLMTIGCLAAMASWDLVLFNQSMVGDRHQPNVMLLEKLHLQALAIAVSLGLLLSILSLNIRLHLPFVLVAGLIILAAFGLIRGYKYFLR